MRQTSDGGYILGGYSTSDISGDKSEADRGDTDYWVVKVNSLGVKQWDKTLGGSGIDAKAANIGKPPKPLSNNDPDVTNKQVLK